MDELSHATLMSRLRHGANAMAVAQVASQLISLVSVSLLMRMLSPDEFGLVGMVAPLVLFLRIFANGGLMEVAIREEAFTPTLRSTLFWTHLLLGLTATVATMAAALPFAAIYDKPALNRQLQWIATIFAGTTLLSAVGMQATAQLQHRLQQPLLAKLRISAQIAGSVGSLIGAWYGWGLWSLLCGQYIEIGMLSLTTLTCNGWNWRWPRWNDQVWRFLRSGCALTSITLVLYLADNTWRLITGRLIDQRAVGLYGQAWTLMIKPVYLVTTPVTGLLLSGISRAGMNPKSRQAIVTMFYHAVAYVLMPVSIGLCVVAHDVMEVVGGDAWSDAGNILRCLSCGLFGQAIFILGGCLFTAAGQMRSFFIVAIIAWGTITGSHVTGWYVAASYAGNADSVTVVGLAAGWAFGINTILFPMTIYCFRLLDISLSEVLKGWKKPLFASLLMGGIVAIAAQPLTSVNPPVRLIVLVVVGLLSYAAIVRQEIKRFLSSINAS